MVADLESFFRFALDLIHRRRVRRHWRLEQREGAAMVGLYDADGILRFMAADVHACKAYAHLFGLPLSSCSLMPMPRPQEPLFSRRRSRRRGVSSS